MAISISCKENAKKIGWTNVIIKSNAEWWNKTNHAQLNHKNGYKQNIDEYGDACARFEKKKLKHAVKFWRKSMWMLQYINKVSS